MFYKDTGTAHTYIAVPYTVYAYFSDTLILYMEKKTYYLTSKDLYLHKHSEKSIV